MRQVVKEGYDGIEIWWPTKKAEQDTLFALLKKYQLEVGFLTAGHEGNYKDHFDTFKKMIDAAAGNKIQKPYTLIAIQEEIISAMKTTKLLLIIQHNWQNKQASKFTMKHIVHECYIQHLLQEDL